MMSCRPRQPAAVRGLKSRPRIPKGSWKCSSILPLQRHARRTDYEDAPRSLQLQQAHDYESGLNRFAQPYVIGENVAKAISRKQLVEQESLMWQWLSDGAEKRAGAVVFSGNYAGQQLATQHVDIAEFSRGEVFPRRAYDLKLRWRRCEVAILVVEFDLAACLAKSVLLDEPHATKAELRMLAVDNALTCGGSAHRLSPQCSSGMS